MAENQSAARWHVGERSLCLDMQGPAQQGMTAKGRASQAWLPTSPTHPSLSPRAISHCLSSPRFHLFIFPSHVSCRKRHFPSCQNPALLRQRVLDETSAPQGASTDLRCICAFPAPQQGRAACASTARPVPIPEHVHASAEHRDVPAASKWPFPSVWGVTQQCRIGPQGEEERAGQDKGLTLLIVCTNVGVF